MCSTVDWFMTVYFADVLAPFMLVITTALLVFDTLALQRKICQRPRTEAVAHTNAVIDDVTTFAAAAETGPVVTRQLHTTTHREQKPNATLQETLNKFEKADLDIESATTSEQQQQQELQDLKENASGARPQNNSYCDQSTAVVAEHATCCQCHSHELCRQTIERLTAENMSNQFQVEDLRVEIRQLEQEKDDLWKLLQIVQLQSQRDCFGQSSVNSTLASSTERNELQLSALKTNCLPSVENDLLDSATCLPTVDIDQIDSSAITSYTYNSDVDTENCATFQIVFAGDSGVGKTSFIRRLCTQQDFMSTFSTTVGVDFLMKTLVVNRHKVTLQLWDTAGQERFRSVTQQYFRQADGIIIMYDVTSEASFRNLHTWLDYVQTDVSDGTVLVLVGNKQDLVEGSTSRAVTEQDGVVFAQDLRALFSETSAKSGSGVAQIVEEMTSMLLLRHMTSSELDNKNCDIIKVCANGTRAHRSCCGLSTTSSRKSSKRSASRRTVLLSNES